MKLTGKIIRALPPIHSTENIPLEDKMIICKFYTPGGWNWYMFEGDMNYENHSLFFGMAVRGNEAVMAFFHLSDFMLLMKEGYEIELDESVFKVRCGDILSIIDTHIHPFYKDFLNEKIIRVLSPLGSTKDFPREITICKFFTLSGELRSLDVLEGEFNVESGYKFFGRANIDGEDEKGELRHFYLSDLLKINTPAAPILITCCANYSD
jgi:hypothetical protein